MEIYELERLEREREREQQRKERARQLAFQWHFYNARFFSVSHQRESIYLIHTNPIFHRWLQGISSWSYVSVGKKTEN